MNKAAIKTLFLKNLEECRAQVLCDYDEAKEAARDAPGAMQSHSDTSKFQSNMLADEFRAHGVSLEAAIREFDLLFPETDGNIVVGSLVGAEERGILRYFYIIPRGAREHAINIGKSYYLGGSRGCPGGNGIPRETCRRGGFCPLAVRQQNYRIFTIA